ncbi:MAG: ribose-5-phosphate isomerase RpiA [Chloroflexi bacterium]|nr:ribose-5-phosphate isomerase RpiA [Chloroflexota bacterium]MDE2649301.1 ribose-5-phosphate isomerase RpiA [Chloroflexota bacterium]MXX52247.1 ribose-5-phosphate isomerase RpiA [Chloroflexota bacterium]MXX82925.1 ribose-5-phosphate isomerase RpiA [Chloroflexota bacterium]MYA92992.1 ribose-5-phosphate isomerase RpiA [Chloroflexota bacterium]
MTATDRAALKQQAGAFAADLVQSGMIVGLGTGSTAIHATRRIAQRLRNGELRNIRAMPTSRATEAAASELRIPLVSFADTQRIDMTIDGADEVDPGLNLIKGGGGALLREKIVAQSSDRFVIVVDDSKLSSRLGSRFAVPVEVVEFGWQAQARYLEALGAKVSLRLDDSQRYRTDQGNFILDCDFGPIADVAALALKMEARAGIVEHGLFLGMAQQVVVASPADIRTLPATSK